MTEPKRYEPCPPEFTSLLRQSIYTFSRRLSDVEVAMSNHPDLGGYVLKEMSIRIAQAVKDKLTVTEDRDYETMTHTYRGEIGVLTMEELRKVFKLIRFYESEMERYLSKQQMASIYMSANYMLDQEEKPRVNQESDRRSDQGKESIQIKKPWEDVLRLIPFQSEYGVRPWDTNLP